MTRYAQSAPGAASSRSTALETAASCGSRHEAVNRYEWAARGRDDLRVWPAGRLPAASAVELPAGPVGSMCV